ncbi:MAG TPA: helix-turn-helix transcriptional regulator [Bdellovibrionales bacterium]|nr:helix-turn-helix transcriptional regulator [Bdellovibrionales bacterium]
MEPFAKRIAQLRLKRGLTQKEVAKAVKVPLSTYKEWEYGRRIQGEHIYVALAETLGVTLRGLLTGHLESEKNQTLEKVDLAIKQMESARKSLLSSL